MDAEFQLLATSAGGTSEGVSAPNDDNVVLFGSALGLISEGLLVNDNYELVQSYLCLLLKV